MKFPTTSSVRFLSALILTAAAVSAMQAQTIISYNFGVGSANTAVSTDTMPNLSAGAATVVNAVSSTVTNSSPMSSGYTLDANGTSVAASSNYHTALTQLAAGGLDLENSTYIQLTLTPEAGTAVALNYVGFGARVLINTSAQASPTTYSIRSSVDNYATSLTTQTFTQGTSYNAYQNAISLTGAVDQAVTLRIYFYGSGGESRAGNTRFDDLTLGAVPEPSTYALMGVAGFVVFMAVRRRKMAA